jgi:hypothetical protein
MVAHCAKGGPKGTLLLLLLLLQAQCTIELQAILTSRFGLFETLATDVTPTADR